MSPSSMTDANGTISEVAVDALGRVVKTAIRGKNGEGDSLADPSVRLTYGKPSKKETR